MRLRLIFERRYLLRQTPWDTGETPPEVMSFLEGRHPGRALDIGCGTGTNAMTLARLGWAVTAIDFSRLALGRARPKAQAAGLPIEFARVDVRDFAGVRGPFDLALDIGCFHSLSPGGRARYASRLPSLLAPHGAFILFCFLAGNGEDRWPSGEAVEAAFGTTFRPVRVEHGETFGQPSAYYTWEKAA
jgi:SAM-dependent methyltransferase